MTESAQNSHWHPADFLIERETEVTIHEFKKT